MIKYFIKYLLQKVLGTELYLFIFAKFVIRKLKWDKNERDFLHFLSLLEDNGILLDIGANIGAMTVYMAKKFSHSEIYSFEPIPLNIRVLKKIIKSYHIKNVKIKETALGDYSGQAKMILPVIHSVTMHGLSHIEHFSIPGFSEGVNHTVKMMKLDDIDELTDKNIKGIKLDVENYEYFVLKGGIEMIKRCKPVIYCELWDNENRKNTIILLESIGYCVKVKISGELKPYNKTIHSTQNFFFIPVDE